MATEFAEPIGVEEFRKACFDMHVPLITRLLREKQLSQPYDLYFILQQLRAAHVNKLGHPTYVLTSDEVKHLDSLINTVVQRFKIRV